MITTRPRNLAVLLRDVRPRFTADAVAKDDQKHITMNVGNPKKISMKNVAAESESAEEATNMFAPRRISTASMTSGIGI